MRRTLALGTLLLLGACRTPDSKPDTGDTGGCTWYADADGDGWGDADNATLGPCEGLSGWVADATDCDDGAAAIHPEAPEVCDGLDQDCDGTADDDAVDAQTSYADADGDGYGDPDTAILACEVHTGRVLDGTDCDDTAATVHPDAPERCNEVDDDCDGDLDEDVQTRWYPDGDGDGFGDPGLALDSCDPGAGWVVDATDCDDGDATVHPGAEETCDARDEDCDGEVDEGLAETWYADGDGDGFGDAATVLEACDPGPGWTQDATDCDDANSAISPAATEVCDGYDDDCDALVDDEDPDVADPATWYTDADADTFGDDALPVVACEQPAGTAALGGDCDDADPAYNPGATEDDCADPADYNCDGSTGWADADADGYAACEECDDGDAGVNPDATEVCDGVDNDCSGGVDEDDAADAATWYADTDADGYGDAAATATACAAPAGFVASDTDCDDADAGVHPGAAERCDGADQDCDGAVDEGVTSTYYADADADGYGDPAATTTACSAPSGWVADRTDCDDADATAHPGAAEVCDGDDEDCDGAVDEPSAVDAATWYRDADADGYGLASASTIACTAPSGYVADGTDCDDRDDDVHPGADEHCDGDDEDCDGAIDDSPVDAGTWYADADGDGYGDAATATTACTAPAGAVADDRDCDDTLAAVNPAATETCNGYDDDCDGLTDDDDSRVAGTSTWYRDADGDGYGSAGHTRTACAAPSGYIADATDCDDLSAAVHPGAAEICNGDDDDCDGLVDDDDPAVTGTAMWYADDDGDGYGDAGRMTHGCAPPAGYVSDTTDCDDTDAAVHPGAAETCNGDDDDCDGLVDDDDPGVTGTVRWYLDYDGDGWGATRVTANACTQPSGYEALAGDCDDMDADAFPGNPEVCDGIDNDCDGLDDDDDPGLIGALTWYADLDGDGYGDATDSVATCEAPSGYIADASDCDDVEPTVHPGADELYDSLDNDCDGDVDEDLWVGTGADGDLDVTGVVDLSADASGTRLWPDAVRYGVTAISGDAVTVDDAADGLAAGDEVLLINLQGTDAAHAAVGTWEFASVAGVAGATVTLAQAVAEVYGEVDNGDLTDQVVVLQRVPHYQDVNVWSGGVLTTDAWDGTGGGVLALRARGTLWLQDGGLVDVSELGYPGGETGTCYNCDAFQGESYAGPGVGNVYGGPYNQSIGGYLANEGGGGANVTGGGGNHAAGATAGVAWAYGYYSYTAPAAGSSYGVSSLATIFPGSGGGGVWNGGNDDPIEDPGPGGDGGGILYIGCGLLQADGVGALAALGGTTYHWAHGTWTYGAGGGAGGSVYLIADEVDLAADAVDASGGFGESTHIRAGGDGGFGRVRIDCNTCNGYAWGTSGATAALRTAAVPDPGYSGAP